jgi:hypothetical protein
VKPKKAIVLNIESLLKFSVDSKIMKVIKPFRLDIYRDCFEANMKIRTIGEERAARRIGGTW